MPSGVLASVPSDVSTIPFLWHPATLASLLFPQTHQDVLLDDNICLRKSFSLACCSVPSVFELELLSSLSGGGRAEMRRRVQLYDLRTIRLPILGRRYRVGAFFLQGSLQRDGTGSPTLLVDYLSIGSHESLTLS